PTSSNTRSVSISALPNAITSPGSKPLPKVFSSNSAGARTIQNSATTSFSPAISKLGIRIPPSPKPFPFTPNPRQSKPSPSNSLPKSPPASSFACKSLGNNRRPFLAPGSHPIPIPLQIKKPLASASREGLFYLEQLSPFTAQL